MRAAEVQQRGRLAGRLEEIDQRHYRFTYAPAFDGEPISRALPVRDAPYEFNEFPPLFEGLLPEGAQLEALLRRFKVDKHDLFRQLVIVGGDVVGSLTVHEAT